MEGPLWWLYLIGTGDYAPTAASYVSELLQKGCLERSAVCGGTCRRERHEVTPIRCEGGRSGNRAHTRTPSPAVKDIKLARPFRLTLSQTSNYPPSSTSSAASFLAASPEQFGSTQAINYSASAEQRTHIHTFFLSLPHAFSSLIERIRWWSGT